MFSTHHQLFLLEMRLATDRAERRARDGFRLAESTERRVWRRHAP